MTATLTIEIIIMAALLLILAAGAAGQGVTPAVVSGLTAADKEAAVFESDPSDYNIDYGTEAVAGENQPLMKELVKFECDPCDYNIDYGTASIPDEK